jgi:hypothetical protein
MGGQGARGEGRRGGGGEGGGGGGKDRKEGRPTGGTVWCGLVSLVSATPKLNPQPNTLNPKLREYRGTFRVVGVSCCIMCVGCVFFLFLFLNCVFRWVGVSCCVVCVCFVDC